MSAKNLMGGLTTYTDPEELAASAVAHEQSVSVIVFSAITVSVITTKMSLTEVPD